MNEQDKSISLDSVKGLSDKAREQLRSIPFPKEQFLYLQWSRSEINMINDFVEKGGRFRSDPNSYQTSYTWPDNNKSMGVINIGTQKHMIKNGELIDLHKLLSFNTIAHELGHALGPHSDDSIKIENNITAYSLDEYLQSKRRLG